jgi:hypothetical protein
MRSSSWFSRVIRTASDSPLPPYKGFSSTWVLHNWAAPRIGYTLKRLLRRPNTSLGKGTLEPVLKSSCNCRTILRHKNTAKEMRLKGMTPRRVSLGMESPHVQKALTTPWTTKRLKTCSVESGASGWLQNWHIQALSRNLSDRHHPLHHDLKTSDEV